MYISPIARRAARGVEESINLGVQAMKMMFEDGDKVWEARASDKPMVQIVKYEAHNWSGGGHANAAGFDAPLGWEGE